MELYLFLASVLLLGTGLVCIWRLTSARADAGYVFCGVAVGVCTGVLSVFAALGIAGVTVFAALGWQYLTMALSLLLCGGAGMLLRRKYPDGIRREGDAAHIGAFAIRLMAVLLTVEVLVCNSACYTRIWKGAPTTALPLSGEVQVSGASAVTTDDGVTEYRLHGNQTRVVIMYTGVDVPMGTLGLFFETDAGTVEYSVDFSDETHKALRTGLIEGKMYPVSEFTGYLVTDTSGRIGDLRVTFTLPKGTETFTIRDGCVTLNPQVPYHFSLIRVLSVYLFLAFLFLLLRARVMRDPVSLRWGAAKTAVICMTTLFALSAVACCAMRSSGWYEDWHMTTGNQMTKELVDAFRAGQLHLLREPSEELLALENPYDWSQRSGISYAWDHLLFDGKYYSYYGIAPVILLFLPYNLLTGFYFPSCWAVCIFGVLGMVFLGMFWHEFVKRFFLGMPVGMYIGGLCMLEVSSGVYYCYAVTNFYEIAQIAGFCFVIMGAYFLISSGVVGKGNISRLRLAASAVCMSLAVLSRPTEVIWCLVTLIFLFFGFRKCLALSGGEPGKRRVISALTYLACALLPYAVFGLVQMLYNYFRFGSVLDFGIQYSLTINDFTRAEFGLRSALIAFWNFLFAPPSFTDTFPFINSSFTKLDLNGYYYLANRNAIGIFFRALPVFALFAAPKLLRLVEDRGARIQAAVIGTGASVVAPAVILYSIWESGYSVRYCMDFYWQMTVCALGLVALLVISCRNEQLKRLYCTVFTVTVGLCVLVCFALYFRYFADNSDSVGFELFGRLFAFWVS